MKTPTYTPLVVLTRGPIVESMHYGAFAIVDSEGGLIASSGDPLATTYLRSSAKPLQALPFIESKGHIHWGLTNQEIAIMCASHTGTDAHVQVLAGLQAKTGVSETDLLCGVHPPIDETTRIRLLKKGQAPTPNRHNCSGKHSQMLALCRLTHQPLENYIDPSHPVQQQILTTFCEMCDLDSKGVVVGMDGCSAPVFAVPLKNAALGYARLCDPHSLSSDRAAACQTITSAMTSHPDMVSGPGKFDTRLMAVAGGKIISKGGAEGYQQIGILPGGIRPGSPGIGIAIKISDGDARGRARPAVALEILRQLGALTPTDLEKLADFGPRFPVHNWRNIVVGEGSPLITL